MKAKNAPTICGSAPNQPSIIQQLKGSESMAGIGEIFFKVLAISLPLLLVIERVVA